MAKVSIGIYTQKNEEFAKLIKGNAVRYGKDGREVSVAGGKCGSIYYKRMRHPEEMTVQELRAYIKEMQIPEEDVLNFLYLRRTGT